MFCVTTACVCSKQTGNFVQLDCVIRAALIFYTIRVGWQDIVAFHTTTSHHEQNILLNNVLEKLERWSSTRVAIYIVYSNRNGDANKWQFALVLMTNLLPAFHYLWNYKPFCSINFSIDYTMSMYLLITSYSEIFVKNLPPFLFHSILLCMSLEQW